MALESRQYSNLPIPTTLAGVSGCSKMRYSVTSISPKLLLCYGLDLQQPAKYEEGLTPNLASELWIDDVGIGRYASNLGARVVLSLTSTS